MKAAQLQEHHADQDRRWRGLLVVLGVVATRALLIVLLFPNVIVNVLSTDSVELDLGAENEEQRRLNLPPTNVQIRLEIQPVDRAPRVSGAVAVSPGVYVIDSCTSGCSVLVDPLPSEAAAQAQLRVTYLLGDSEYLNDLRFG